MKILVALLLSFFFLLSNAQPVKTEVLNNKNVTELLKAGLSSEIVITKINTSNCKFDVSAAGLIELKKQAVAENVIDAMIRKMNEKPGAGLSIGLSPSVNSSPKQVPVTDQINYVYAYQKNKTFPLEKALGKSKSKRKSFGYGGNMLLLETEGETSSVKFSKDSTEAFVINMGSNTSPDLVLYKLTTEKNKRVALTGKLTLSGPESGEGIIQIEIAKISEGIFSIKPAKKLETGEYFFTSKPNLNSSMATADVFAFRIL